MDATSAAVAVGAEARGASAVRRLDPDQAQLVCRAINEHILEISQCFGFDGDIDIVCECARPGCFELIRVSPKTFRAVRQFQARFLLKPGHLSPHAERALAGSDGHTVVERLRSDSSPRAASDPPSVLRRPARQSLPVRDWLPESD